MHPAAFLEPVLKALQSAGATLPADWRAVSLHGAAMALTALWQGAAVALGLTICLRLAPRSSAADRFAVWAAGFGVLVALQFLPLLSLHAAAPAHATTAAAAQAAFTPWIQLDARWSFWIAGLWIAASIYRAFDLALHSIRLRRLWKSGTPVELDGSLSSLAGKLRIRGRKTAQICTTSHIERPGVIGFLSPRILIPDWLFTRLTPGELEQIVLHEAEHLRRADDWTNLLQKLCLVLFPLNPALAWIERCLCREREMACDDGVIRITHAPRAYAACLARLAERGLQRRAEALSLGAWQRRPELAHRVHSVLRRRQTLHPMAARVALGAAACGLVFGSVELARCPQLFAFVQPRTTVTARSDAQRIEARNVPPAPKPLHATAQEDRAPAAFHRAERRTAVARAAAAEPQPATLAASVRHAAPQRQAMNAELASAVLPRENPLAPANRRESVAEPSVAKRSEEEQGWIVLTTWQQVQVPARAVAAPAEQQPSAVDTAATPASMPVSAPASAPVSTQASVVTSTASKGGAQAKRQGSATRQITVTRLLLRIYCAELRQKQPAGAMFQSDWFVIQL